MRAFFSTLAKAAMSGDSHESSFKNTVRMLAVGVLLFVALIVVIVLLAKLATSGRIYDKDSPSMSAEEIGKRIKPVANVVVEGGGKPGEKASRTGEEIYKAVCTACHSTGVAKAPKFGDKGDWARRIHEGQKALVQVALKGEGAMPPRGGASDLSDLEVERAVVYMANAAGASFKEPAAGKAPAPAQAPAAKPAPASAPVAAAATADGKKVYESTCIACHGLGVANAPRFGDKKAWAPHLAHGAEHLYQNALKGLGAMPPKGGNLTLSDADVKAAVDYMLNAVK